MDTIVEASPSKDIVNHGAVKPLWLAASEGHQMVIRRLAKYKGHVRTSEAVAADRTNPLIMACLKGHEIAFDALAAFYTKEQVCRYVVYARQLRKKRYVTTLYCRWRTS